MASSTYGGSMRGLAPRSHHAAAQRPSLAGPATPALPAVVAADAACAAMPQGPMARRSVKRNMNSGICMPPPSVRLTSLKQSSLSEMKDPLN